MNVGGFHGALSLDTNFGGGTGTATAPNTVWGIPGTPTSVTATAAAIIEGDDAPLSGGDEEFYVAATVNYCGAGLQGVSGSNMAIVDFLSTGATKSGWGNGNGATAPLNFGANCTVSASQESAYAMVGSDVGGTKYLTVVGSGSGKVLTARFTPADGLLDTAAYGPVVGGGPTRKGFAYGPTGAGFAAVLDPSVNRVLVSGTGGSNDFLATRFKDDGTLDGTFGNAGSITIDFGSTSGVTTDGGKAIAMRTQRDELGNIIGFDIVVGGYTFDSVTGKFKISLVDLLDDNTFDVS